MRFVHALASEGLAEEASRTVAGAEWGGVVLMQNLVFKSCFANARECGRSASFQCRIQRLAKDVRRASQFDLKLTK